MLYLLCITYAGDVEVRNFDSLSDRAHFSDTMDRLDYRHIIEVTGSLNTIKCRGQRAAG